MEIKINYDFFNEIKNGRNKHMVFKVIREYRKNLAFVHFPFCMVVNLHRHSFANSIKIYGIDFLFAIGILSVMDLFAGRKFGKDPYKGRAEERLTELSGELRKFGVSPDYNAMLKSELYERKYKFKLNSRKIPTIVESKYVLIPSSLTADKVSIVQEHVVGSRQYTLSRGVPMQKPNFRINRAI